MFCLKKESALKTQSNVEIFLRKNFQSIRLRSASCVTTLNKRLVKPKICRLKKQSKCEYYHDSPLQTNLTLMHISLRIIFIFISFKNLNYLLTCIQKTFCCHDKDGSVQVRPRKSVSGASIVRKKKPGRISFLFDFANQSIILGAEKRKN